MLRYIVLILLIVLFILILVNVIFTKLLRTLTILRPKTPKKNIKSTQEVLYQDDEIIVLKGESKQEKRDSDERN